jgi:hypothetical protein
MCWRELVGPVTCGPQPPSAGQMIVGAVAGAVAGAVRQEDYWISR